ncbi:uncharacterized protein LOC121404808 [Drosophila obscura]|uniref:uncharacterized protein LOC121404808 n=1 Tax=Drosophila obscura TaxID=7282 RepID=UPI001BB10644|nr:uncharacterized protein LOC121404808 [Drosophila obscura]
MRACGRIQASASMSYNEKHPILLPPASLLVRLLVRFTHHIVLHGENQLATSDLSTDTFLAAFTLFVARRGCPHEVQSDNGSNFVGASRALAVDLLEAIRTWTSAVYSQQGLSWRFIPPGAPHMGGLWEAGVKSFKTLFQRSMYTAKYTLEEFATLLSKNEACLNSRPISPMSEDPNDPLALSPGHFLIGGPLLSVAEPEIKESASSILNRWQHLQALNQQFCSRWKTEYLRELHKRTKWQHPTRDLEVGDLVVIKEDNIPSHEWRLGRVQKTYPGPDDKVRVIDLTTVRGLIKRPITKVVLLPMESEIQSTYSRVGSDP